MPDLGSPGFLAFFVFCFSLTCLVLCFVANNRRVICKKKETDRRASRAKFRSAVEGILSGKVERQWSFLKTWNNGNAGEPSGNRCLGPSTGEACAPYVHGLWPRRGLVLEGSPLPLQRSGGKILRSSIANHFPAFWPENG